MKVPAAVLAGIAALSSSFASPQDKDMKPAQDWVEVTPEKKDLFDAKRILKFDEGLVLEVALIRKDFFGRDSISAHGWVSNPTKKKLKGQYYVSLFDKDKKLIVCGNCPAGVIDPVEPGAKDEQLSVILEGPSAELDKVKFAQYRWYVHE